jgi:adenylate kinase
VTVAVLLGVPGAGKGTQAQILAKRLGVPHISTGDLFRAAVRDNTVVGREASKYMERGELVPDEITIRMLLDRLNQPDAASGAILDGFPRNRHQAESLDRALAERGARVDRAVHIEVPAEDLLRRLSGRWVCQAAGHVYNEATHPPRVPGVCDIDGSPLVQRDDDRVETIKARLAQQIGALDDVVIHYRAKGVLGTVDGRQPVDVVTDAVLANLPAPTGESA